MFKSISSFKHESGYGIYFSINYLWWDVFSFIYLESSNQVFSSEMYYDTTKGISFFKLQLLQIALDQFLPSLNFILNSDNIAAITATFQDCLREVLDY